MQYRFPARWTSNNLDYIVENGNKFYVSLPLDRYLEVEDLPDHLCIANSVVNITRRFNISSILTTDKDDIDAFTYLTEQNTSDNFGFLLWLREICIAVILKHTCNKAKRKFHMFDSHSRNKNGQVDEHGASILVVFNTIEYFVSYICVNYLNENNNHRIPYVLQFLKCNSFQPLYIYIYIYFNLYIYIWINRKRFFKNLIKTTSQNHHVCHIAWLKAYLHYL